MLHIQRSSVKRETTQLNDIGMQPYPNSMARNAWHKHVDTIFSKETHAVSTIYLHLYALPLLAVVWIRICGISSSLWYFSIFLELLRYFALDETGTLWSTEFE